MIIDQFMWGFQYHFRASVGYDVKRVLETIGLELEPTVFLVGFAASDSARHRICIEPERGPLTQSRLEAVESRAHELYSSDPESTYIHSHRPLHDAIQSRLYRQWRGFAICELVESSDLYGHVRAFASASAPIGGYEVHTCVLVDADVFDALPAFDDVMFDRMYVGRSLQHEVLADALRRADHALYLPDPGAGLNVLGATAAEIVASAAGTFVRGCVARTGEVVPGEVFDEVNAVTSLAYERAGATGRLVFVRANHSALDVVAKFELGIPLRRSRAIRKLLETTDDSLAVLCDGDEAFGLGRITDADAQGVFTVSVPSHATWLLSHRGVDLMRVSYTRAALPKPILDRNAFDDAVARVIGDADLDALWALVEAASASGHGSTVVVSSDAASEAARLAGQATVITPVRLDPGDVGRIGRIDGAMLVDRSGTCHAIAVILDGAASGVGDPARGSRFNSSVRYQMAAPAQAVVLVISDDGTVDLVPSLRRRYRRAEIAAVVDEFVAAATSDPVVGELFGRAYDRVRRVAFYLDEQQCAVVNDLHEAEQERRFAAGGFRVMQPQLAPHPEMDDSYFVE